MHTHTSTPLKTSQLRKRIWYMRLLLANKVLRDWGDQRLENNNNNHNTDMSTPRYTMCLLREDLLHIV